MCSQGATKVFSIANFYAEWPERLFFSFSFLVSTLNPRSRGNSKFQSRQVRPFFISYALPFIIQNKNMKNQGAHYYVLFTVNSRSYLQDEIAVVQKHCRVQYLNHAIVAKCTS